MQQTWRSQDDWFSDQLAVFMCAARWTKYQHGANITLNLVSNFEIQILLQENAFDLLNSSLAGQRSRTNGDLEVFLHSGRAQIGARAKSTKQGVVGFRSNLRAGGECRKSSPYEDACCAGQLNRYI